MNQTTPCLLLSLVPLAPALPQLVEHASAGDGLPRFGRSVCALGDLDGDGVQEFAVGASRAGTEAAPNSGSVLIFSGAERRVIRRFDGPRADIGFGEHLWQIEDLDGDGQAELLVEGESGAAAVVSPASGEILWLHEPEEHLLFHCPMVASLLDADEDGVRDHLLMASVGTYFLSGRTGEPVPRAGTSKWWPVGDLDGDREPEKLLPDEGSLIGTAGGGWYRSLRELGHPCHWSPRKALDWNEDGSTDWIVGVSVVSGSDGSILHTWNGDHLPGKDPTIRANFGDALVVPGDLDGDGTADVVIGSPGMFYSAVVAYSGAAPDEMLWIVRDDGWERYGTSLDSLADVDGDGVRDILVGGTDCYPGSAVAPGAVWILSGKSGRVVWTLRAGDVEGL